MKEYFRNLTAVLSTSAALLSNGCGFETQREVCEMTGGEIKNIDGPARAREICTESKANIMKCIKSEEGAGDTVIQTIQCSSKDADTQIAAAFSDSDYTICNASKNADKIKVSCQ